MKSFVIALVIASCAVSLSAQTSPTCTEADTPLSCFDKFMAPEKAAKETQATNATQKEVATANTGATTLSSPSSTALKDFLSFFAASVDSAVVSEKGNALTLDWNLPFPIIDKNERTLKFQATFSKPEVSSDVSNALSANSSAMTTLNNSLSNTDDIAGSLTYSPVNQSYGRSITPNLSLFRPMILAILNNDAIKDARDKGLRKVLKDHKELVDAKTPFTAIKDSDQRDEAIAAMQAAAQAASASFKRIDTLVKNFARLLNNQPQIYGSVVYHDRKDIVGPSTVSGKFTYEIGTANLNRFRAANNGKCSEASIAANAVTCLTELDNFTKQNGGLEAESTDRLTLSAEYQQSRANRVDLSAYSITDPLVTSHTHSLVYSAKYGRSMITTNGRDGRIDLTAYYENYSNDPMKKDRFVGSVTFTQKITETMSIPLSLIYANHSQFLSDVDRKLNVHFGLTYKLPDVK